jgi:hypothetical protein
MPASASRGAVNLTSQDQDKGNHDTAAKCGNKLQIRCSGGVSLGDAAKEQCRERDIVDEAIKRDRNGGIHEPRKGTDNAGEDN